MEKVFGIVRHIVGLIGGVLIGIGVMDADQSSSLLTNVDAIAGGVLAVVAVVASVVSKLKDFKFFK